jgi:hypothetical protein
VSFFELVKQFVRGWNGVYLFLLAVILVLFFYKSHTTGTWYDESLTFKDYCSSIHQARHSFKSTNNHVLNSVCICLAKVCFGGYEQFIRIPTMITGTVFILSIAWMIRKMVGHPTLRCFILVFIFSIPFVFSYLFTARGYSYSMAAMGVYMVGAVYLYEHPVRLRLAWLVIAFFSFLNFVSLGAMLGSIFLVVALNGVFILWLAPKIYSDNLKPLFAVLLNGLGIAALSCGALIWFYWPILNDVIHVADNPYVASIAQSWKGWESFGPFVNKLFVRCIFDFNKGGLWLFRLFVALVAVGVLSRLYDVIKAGMGSTIKKTFQTPTAGVYVLFVFLLYFGVFFFYSVVLGKSPGLHRSHVFFLPLIGLLFGWLMDGLLQKLPRHRWRSVGIGLVCVYIFVAAMHYTPSLKPGKAAMSRHVLKRLKEYDPQQTWNLCFSKNMISQSMGFHYYRQFDYRFNITGPQQCDVFICSPAEQPKGGVCIDYDYFLDQCRCVLVLNRKVDTEKYVLEITPKKSK